MKKLHKYFAYDSPSYKTVMYYTQIEGENYIGVEYSIQRSGNEFWQGTFHDTLGAFERDDMDDINIAVLDSHSKEVISHILEFVFASENYRY